MHLMLKNLVSPHGRCMEENLESLQSSCQAKNKERAFISFKICPLDSNIRTMLYSITKQHHSKVLLSSFHLMVTPDLTCISGVHVMRCREGRYVNPAMNSAHSFHLNG